MLTASKKSAMLPLELSATVADKVEKKLILAIGLGELKSGERVTETGLAETLNVSRVPVREAMQRLNTFGVLQTGDGRGMSVSNYEGQRVSDLMEMRLAVERVMFNRVLIQTESKEKLIKKLEENVACMSNMAPEADTVELTKIDLEFHGIIASHCDNTFVQSVWPGLAPHLMIVFCGDWNVLSHRASAPKDHQDLIEFIKNGSVKDTDAILKQHFPTVLLGR